MRVGRLLLPLAEVKQLSPPAWATALCEYWAGALDFCSLLTAPVKLAALVMTPLLLPHVRLVRY